MARLLITLLLAFPPLAAAQPAYPPPVERPSTGSGRSELVEERDFIVRNFTFQSGETLPEVRIHYRTIGQPRKDADGVARNGIMILHGTGGSGSQFVGTGWAGRLYGKGQPYDAEKYFIILPDNIGHGQSSKPSDGLRMKFPRYSYTDMVRLQHRLATEGLGLARLHIVTGTSMGGMHTWMWGHMFPDFMDALVPLASNPVEIAGRNRVWRKLLVDAIVTDPTWKNGDYTDQPRGLASAIGFLMMATSVPLQWQKQFATAKAADEWLAEQIRARVKSSDANDMIYYFRASEDYDPSKHLDKITAPLLAINSADDFVNPPELPMMETLIKKVRRGKFILIPISDQTRGHGTHTLPAVWGDHLAAFLATVPK